MSSTRFIHAQDLRKRSSALLKEVSDTGDTCYITEDGRAKGVLMDINRYNALMDLIEEAEAIKNHEEHHEIEARDQISVKKIIKK